MFLISIGSVHSMQPVINLPLKICKVEAKKTTRIQEEEESDDSILQWSLTLVGRAYQSF